MTEINRQWLINGNPAGRGVKITDFKRFDRKLVNLKKDELRIKVEHLEFTPSLKGQMENQLDYAAPTKQGQVMRGRGIGEVIESKDHTFYSSFKAFNKKLDKIFIFFSLRC